MKPGPPWNCEPRVTVIVAPSAARLHPIGATQRSSSRPDSVTGFSSISPSSQPSWLIPSSISSFATEILALARGRDHGGERAVGRIAPAHALVADLAVGLVAVGRALALGPGPLGDVEASGGRAGERGDHAEHQGPERRALIGSDPGS